MSPNRSRRDRRIAVLRHMLARWIAALPAVQAVDAERARDHEQAIVDLRRLIAALQADADSKAVPADTQRA